MSKIFISLLIVFGIYSYQGNVDDADLRFVILTWKPGQDTSTEISINFRINDKTEIGKIYYDTRPGDGTPSSYSYSREATSKKFKGLTGNVIQYVELSNLTPGVPYYFIVVDETGEYSKEMKFKTIAKDAENITFVSGGDMGDSDKTIEMMAQAGKLSPDIAIVGGDIAYANGKFDSWERWNRWLKGWKEKMVTPDGFSIPVIAAIGNHETNKWPGPIHAKAPYYYYIFGYGDSTYFYKKFGKNLNLIFLDTGHINSYKGDQLEWMEEQLQELKDERLKVAVYHVPLYPSHRDFHLREAEMGRKYWEPLFNEYKVKFAMENHDHTFKRSKKIWGGSLATNEDDWTLYVGDGAWGKGGREVGPRWYLEKFTSDAHFWLVSLSADQIRFKAISDKEETLDDFTEGY
mgnify:FL=1